MTWRRFFSVKGIQPGEIISPRHGSIDFRRDDLDPDFLLKLWEEDFPYLELTQEGERHFFGLHQENKDSYVETQGRASHSNDKNTTQAKMTAKELCEAIENAQSLEEAAKYYDQGSHYKTVSDAFDRFVEEHENASENDASE